MNELSGAKIISFNHSGEAVCAASARISTTEGDAGEIFARSRGNEKNIPLIKKVLASGHRSVIEHAVFSIEMRNVSAYVEQFFIESRLASFTVKSRRYVDFSKTGYYIPDGLSGKALEAYKSCMDGLFSAYGELIELGVPKEDARFLLPYSFFSNFYCTMNARELVGVINSMKYGRGKNCPELQSLADQLIEQLSRIFPAVSEEFAEGEREYELPEISDSGAALRFYDEKEAGGAQLLNSPKNAAKILEAAGLISPENTVKNLVTGARPRALEQLSYTFFIKNLSLSGITHIVRHRMQSIMVPSVERAAAGHKYILPKTVAENDKALEIYKNAVGQSDKMTREAFLSDELRPFVKYFALSGNLLDVMTTMNARELLLFMRLRTCSRAQWEIRFTAEKMLSLLREDFAELFGLYGPSCYVYGKCPEGRMCCGKQEEMKAKFGNL